MLNTVLLTAIEALNTKAKGIYGMDEDTLYYECEPVCSLNGLVAFRFDDHGIILEFKDAEPVHLMVNGVGRDKKGG